MGEMKKRTHNSTEYKEGIVIRILWEEETVGGKIAYNLKDLCSE